MNPYEKLVKLVKLVKWRMLIKAFLLVTLILLLAAILISVSLALIGLFGFVFLIGAATVLAFVVLGWGIAVVPTVHFGVVTRLKKRTGRIVDEGWRFVIPFLDSVELFSYELVTTAVKVSFFTKNNLEVVAQGSVKWRGDKALGKVFIEMTENTITTGLVDTVKSELGIIGGTKPAEAFIEAREAISFLINCVLRLSEPPHIEAGLAPEDRLEYYVSNAKAIREKLAGEAKNVEDRSHVEQLHGIDVVEFALADVDFSVETKKALELEKQTAARLKAETLEFRKTLSMMKKLKKEGIESQEALNGAQAELKTAPKNVFSLEGLGQLFGPKLPKIIVTRD